MTVTFTDAKWNDNDALRVEGKDGLLGFIVKVSKRKTFFHGLDYLTKEELKAIVAKMDELT